MTDKENCSVDDSCAICLQSAELPIVLPCSHRFCFLCAKGAALRDLRCALCRTTIPEELIRNPCLPSLSAAASSSSTAAAAASATILSVKENFSTESSDDSSDDPVWFYEGRNGWWLYDKRNGAEIEKSFLSGRPFLELLLAGNLYVINFQRMVQHRKTDPSRKRRIKREFPKSLAAKGIAGIAISEEDGSSSSEKPSTSSVDDISNGLDALQISVNQDNRSA